VPTAHSRLSSRQHPIVRAFRRLAADGHAADGVLLDGAHLIREALAARVRLRAVLVSARYLTDAPSLDRELPAIASEAGAAVHEATQPVIEAASPVRTSIGIVAIAEWTAAAFPATFAPAPAMTIALVDVQDPGNVGAVVRSADALGATGVLALDRTAHPGGWKALRGSMGSIFRLPVARGRGADAIAAARTAGLRIIATVAGPSTRLTDIDFSPPTLVLLGNEGTGLDAATAAWADERLTVPMRTGVDSLNVAVTAALVLYEARRQRESTGNLT
jgi:TrmH family RNA methyltransferase